MELRTVGNLDRNYWRFIVSWIEIKKGVKTRFEQGFTNETEASQAFGKFRNLGWNAVMRPGFKKLVTT